MFRHKEERHNLALPSYSFGPHLERPPLGASSLRVCEIQKSILLVWHLVLNSLNFLQIPKILFALPVHDVTHTSSPISSSQAIVTSLSGTSAPRVRYHLHKGLHPTNQRAEPKGSQPN